METQISKWGNSLGLRIPKELALSLGLKDGSRVKVESEGQRLVIDKAAPKYTIEELMADMTPETLRTAMSHADWAFWQTDVGREIIKD